MLSLFFFGKTKNKECLLSLTIKDDRAKSTRLTFIWSSNPLLDDPTPVIRIYKPFLSISHRLTQLFILDSLLLGKL